MTSSQGQVVVFGSLNTDIFARVERHPLPGETITGQGGESRPGGKGANQALAATLNGGRVRMIGAVGTDAHAETALRLLDASGCDLGSVRRNDGPTGLALITVDARGENSIIVILGANSSVGTADVDAVTVSAGDVLVLQGEIPVEACAAAAAKAHDAGARVLVNLAPVVDYPAATLRLADPLVVNEHEGIGALGILGAQGPTEPRDVVEALLQQGVPSVVMTLGSQGALVADPELHEIAAVSVDAVDTTGAGDAFVGALSAVLAAGAPLREAASEASSYAAQTVLHRGAQDSYPDWRSK